MLSDNEMEVGGEGNAANGVLRDRTNTNESIHPGSHKFRSVTQS